MTDNDTATTEWLSDLAEPSDIVVEDTVPDRVLGRALVIVVDDRGAHAAGPKPVGALVTELLEEADFFVDGVVVVPSDEVAVRNALNTAVIGGVDLAITIGGVGVGARDVTPEATEEILDKKLPGICEALRASGLAAGATDACLSRGLAGVSGSTVVVNLASSRAAVRDGMATLCPLAAHVIEHVAGADDQAE
ncbi:MogA/MoaB family molybdenum cofactor biosynthesis protein [Tsukamurella sp. 8F]|uniref:MogA/MoaB family molybdenum cofactor biosynthesis protein n=1 Tax=unclassified Tsukamurella TaxID=2633480 RepID=UPI0023B91048|nr:MULTISPECIES: MogA/MoaB family molybdenum cofactor biosynthesis protein [unclassified Tsukamurella]MDF0532599.1 MogA/MoaB family molybdenum cofactor biosynthesis protein [Tsukamurella sp. 8J]MDF0589391.1 MogA/MoaB family molybdenum cofactor biosynthesis protein [Tsukamurella sp. 8F]